jgi:hypothetical protein
VPAPEPLSVDLMARMPPPAPKKLPVAPSFRSDVSRPHRVGR